MTGAPKTQRHHLAPWLGPIGLALAFGACGNGEEPGAPPGASGCPVLEESQPVTLDADVHVLASEHMPAFQVSPLAPALITDGADVYWFDRDGSVFVERQGAGEVVTLKVGEGDRVGRDSLVVLGITASSDRLYVGDGFLNRTDTFSLRDLSPPSRLFAISKQDGREEQLLELSDRTIMPIAADSERVILFATGRDGTGYYQLRLADLQLEPLPLSAPFETSRVFGDKVYWLREGRPPFLMRSGFDDVEPEMVMRMYVDDYFFSVGPEYIVALERRILSGYRYVGNDFVVHDDSGCRALPAPRGNMSFDVVADAQHAYWHSFRTPPEFTLPPEQFQLNRVDIASGARERLNTPGFTAEPDVRILGEDSTRVFLRSNGVLVAIQKP